LIDQLDVWLVCESGTPLEKPNQERDMAEEDDQLADPTEHPEQHAALQTEDQKESEPNSEEGDELLDSQEHSDAEGPFGTG
jgi:hypothetical protein